MAIVKANYQPRSKTEGIGRSVAYYTWREGSDKPRSWYDADGRELNYDAAKEEVAEHAGEAAYTYRVVLSTREAALDPEAYAQVLSEHFDDWYLTTHHGGEHPHAHAIAFTDHRLQVADFHEMRVELEELEHERQRDLEHDQATDMTR